MWWINFSNGIAIVWALVAACVAVAILAATPYFQEVCVIGWCALVWGLLLLGATPIGVLSWIFVQFLVFLA